MPDPKNKKAALGRLSIDEAEQSLPFGELLAPPGFVQSHLFSLNLSRVTRHESRRAQRGLQPGIVLDQRARDAMAHGTGLAALAAAVDVDPDIEGREVLRELEGLAHHHAAGFAAKELFDRLAIDDDVALARLDEDSRDCALAPSRAVIEVADH